MSGNGLSTAAVIGASIIDCVSPTPVRTYRIPVWCVWCDADGFKDVHETADTVIVRGWSCDACQVNQHNRPF